ncbi:MAG: FIST signal transduction protein [Verrucomicrobiia bacterium]|jgi:small ligand-binding sensory domain FIST
MVKGKSIVAHWQGDFDENSIIDWVIELRDTLGAPVSLGLLFLTPRFFNNAEQILEIIKIYGKIPVLTGCSAGGLIINGSEIETKGGFVLGLYHLPDSIIHAYHIVQQDVDSACSEKYYIEKFGIHKSQVNSWISFGNPFNFDAELWLGQLNKYFPNIPVAGGCADGDIKNREVQLYLDNKVLDNGCVAVSLGGNVEIQVAVSQGAKPIGERWIITKADRNIVYEIANMPAFDILLETFSKVPYREQKKLSENLLVGLAVNEHREELGRGDFVVRTLLGGDPDSGILAIGGFPRPGQSIQFQQRDPKTATEDLEETLANLKKSLRGTVVYGGCLFCCTGRGRSMFKEPNHDASRVQNILSQIPIVGAFCNGEFGPIGTANYLHSYSASLALFTDKKTRAY